MTDVIVKKSKIAGLGVFAARDYKEGEIIFKWDTLQELTKENIEKLPAEEKKYVSFHNGAYVLMPAPGRYVNHSCDPNTVAKDFCDIALRNIKKGEEITSDYSEEGAPGEIMGDSLECRCGSRKCQGSIRV